MRGHVLISSWQPTLNHPFIFNPLNLKSEGWLMQFRKNRQRTVKLSPRLLQRVRRRLFSVESIPSPHSFQEQAWTILYQLSLPKQALKCAREFVLENFMPWKLAHCTDWRRTGGSQQIRIEDFHCKSFIVSSQCHCSENLFDWKRLIASQCHCSENLFTFDNSRSGTRRILYDF